MNKKTLGLMISAILLIGCNDDNAEPVATNTGVFLDSAVSGIQYQTETLSGMTNNNGEFQFINGETVIFSIGETKFPATNAQTIVTPLTIANTENIADDTVTNISRLLQSMDSDGDPSNGIAISEESHDSTISIDVTQSTASFSEEVESQTNITLIPVEDALEHLSETLESEGIIDDSSENDELISVAVAASNYEACLQNESDCTTEEEALDSAVQSDSNLNYDAYLNTKAKFIERMGQNTGYTFQVPVVGLNDSFLQTSERELYAYYYAENCANLAINTTLELSNGSIYEITADDGTVVKMHKTNGLITNLDDSLMSKMCWGTEFDDRGIVDVNTDSEKLSMLVGSELPINYEATMLVTYPNSGTTTYKLSNHEVNVISQEYTQEVYDTASNYEACLQNENDCTTEEEALDSAVQSDSNLNYDAYLNTKAKFIERMGQNTGYTFQVPVVGLNDSFLQTSERELYAYYYAENCANLAINTTLELSNGSIYEITADDGTVVKMHKTNGLITNLDDSLMSKMCWGTEFDERGIVDVNTDSEKLSMLVGSELPVNYEATMLVTSPNSGTTTYTLISNTVTSN